MSSLIWISSSPNSDIPKLQCPQLVSAMEFITLREMNWNPCQFHYLKCVKCHDLPFLIFSIPSFFLFLKKQKHKRFNLHFLDKVEVTFSNGPKREFDLVIGADGMGSKIRRLAFPDENPLKGLGKYTSFFTIPYKEEDGNWGQWYNASGGRCILLRSDNAGYTRAYLSIMSSKPAGYYKLSIPEQKKPFREMFEDAEWQAQRVLDGMDESDDFYMQEIAQVKMEKWSKGRVVLVGDAGYCPSPISGMGTSLAIIGAYILAGELAACKGDWEKALEGYEEKMRPFVTKARRLSPGTPGIVNPQIEWGIMILNSIVGFVSWSGLANRISAVASKFSGPEKEDRRLPLYEF
jgi:2-polyprenyl-6-methoxyphenol hydroxylase-like FAD-dependent oxidoreductase